jgi:ABC-type bacteriocin/lantibiotic exporter with double-glycine peptidase domain
LFFKTLQKLSEKRFSTNKWRFTAVSETFAALKEIKLLGLEMSLIDKFSQPAKKMAKSQATIMAINKLPKFAIEALTFGGMLLISIYLVYTSNDFSKTIPVIALYAFAGYRLLPTFQSIYLNINLLRTVGPPLDALIKDLSNLKIVKKNKENKTILGLNEKISLENLSFQYANSSNKALSELNLSIPAGTSIGITGRTGSGKTTLVDIILGLLLTEQGDMFVDGKKIKNDNVRSWQNIIGYVPQQIYLTDDTITANIAFGKNEDDVDHNKVLEVSKLANIHEFINSDLPLKYQTKVGERGARLSGGQRQRIGIARALYNDPKVLVLDEATSALDSLTEKKIISSILNNKNKKTIILITHNLETIKYFDNIIVLDRGKIIESGKYAKLINESKYFKTQLKN